MPPSRPPTTSQTADSQLPDPLTPLPRQLTVSAEVKDLFYQRMATTNPVTRDALADKILFQLAQIRPDLEVLVERQHPDALEMVNFELNLFEATLEGESNWGTLEVLLDAEAADAVVLELNGRLQSANATSPSATLNATGGLAGTGSQPRVNPYPGDVDLGETLRVEATSSDAGGDALELAVQATVAEVTSPAPGTQALLFLGMSVGVYPPTHPDAGQRISWTPQEVMQGYIRWFVGDREERFSLSDAFADPGSRVANTYWRGPIDAENVWGEVTKVMTYAGFSSVSPGRVLFQTPNIGQDYQTVSFGAPQVLDGARINLLDALYPQIGKYLDDQNYLKANKRAYTTARMFNDIETLNALTPLLAGPMAHLRQVTEQLEMYIAEIVAPGGIAIDVVSEAMAQEEAVVLTDRVRSVDAPAGAAMAAIVADVSGEIRGNAVTAEALTLQVLEPLELKALQDADYAQATTKVLTERGYLEKGTMAMTTTTSPRRPVFEEADDAWLAGDLPLARALYGHALVSDPDDWAAAFQAAWIDACFQVLDSRRIDALDTPSLEAGKRDLVQRLRARTSPELGPDPLAGDIRHVRVATRALDRMELRRRAAVAANAGQHGLARAVLSELIEREPLLYGAKPPREYTRALLAGEQHVKTLRS